jgi:hypothetical protein
MAPYRSYPDQKIKDLVATRLIKRGLFTGSTKAALVSDRPLDYVGVETEKLYQENYALWKHSDELRETVLAQMKAWKEKLKAKANLVYSPELLKAANLRESLTRKKSPFFNIICSFTNWRWPT